VVLKAEPLHGCHAGIPPPAWVGHGRGSSRLAMIPVRGPGLQRPSRPRAALVEAVVPVVVAVAVVVVVPALVVVPVVVAVAVWQVVPVVVAVAIVVTIVVVLLGEHRQCVPVGWYHCVCPPDLLSKLGPVHVEFHWGADWAREALATAMMFDDAFDFVAPRVYAYISKVAKQHMSPQSSAQLAYGPMFTRGPNLRCFASGAVIHEEQPSLLQLYLIGS